jgi:UDP-N-acetylmuramate dehydrogenase
MNAGGHGSDVRTVLRSARIFELGEDHVGDVPADRLELGYRRSALAPGSVVVGARFGLEPGTREAAEGAIAEIVRWRREHQPGGSNAGSVFSNPPGDSAGRLIEAAGLKGMRRGSAFVSPKHANFVQVDDRGSADDVAALLGEVSRLVAERTGVRLRLENHLVGFPEERS